MRAFCVEAPVVPAKGRRLVLLVLLLGAIVVHAAAPSEAARTEATLKLVASGFESPVHLEAVPDNSGRLAIVDRAGTVHLLTRQGRLLAEPFLDVRPQMVRLSANYDERGLLGLAFHPAFADNGRLYVYYSVPLRPQAPDGWNHTSRISEFTVASGDPNRADPDSERIILEIDQPQANHNGGALAFGPDGYLYIGLGDGGGGNDVGLGHPPLGNGQDVSTLLGSVLRIDVDSAERSSVRAYSIPPDNPFADGGGRPEIYAWGFRNPYRLSFDRGGARRLIVADVGQNLWEEINVVTGPGNFGWRLKEGIFWFDPDRPRAVITEGPATGPGGEPLMDPVIQYGHPDLRAAEQTAARHALSATGIQDGGLPAFGISVIGGYVYRGTALPEWRGSYIFGDWSTSFGIGAGKILMATPPGPDWLEIGTWRPDPDGPPMLWPVELVLEVPRFVLGFGEDADGELYVLTTNRTGPFGGTGEVYKIVPNEG